MNPENEKIIIENPEVNEKDNETKVVVNEQIIDDTLEFLNQIEETDRSAACFMHDFFSFKMQTRPSHQHSLHISYH